MKIKYIAAIYVVLILAVGAFFFYVFANIKVPRQDMVKLNSDVNDIETDIVNGAKLHELEKKYDCEIVLANDGEYEAKINNAIKNESTIVDLYENENIIGKAIWSLSSSGYDILEKRILLYGEVLCLFLLIIGIVIFAILYIQFVKPFKKLQSFSNEVAKGNLEVPLSMNRNNYFGAFTESFDIMREELKRAKENENKANISKKELVAKLSHDIKTPISTIKATCEILEVKEDNKDTLEKVSVISKKADLIDKLITNMFQATLEELEVLRFEVTEEDSILIPQIISELKYYDEIIFANQIPECLVYLDKIRFTQVVDNIIGNAHKYAGTKITVNFERNSDGIFVHIKDYGTGVSKEELPLITSKYYRGGNAEGKSGSGLGLYIAKTFMDRMKGSMEILSDNGFEVILFVKKV